ncbi:Putative alpha-L-fucosidase [Eumeta japonica]|uniref:Putative alpha-L-fucosidase n=1 Tax=Eumeta variegata TaxID=151549 RepID=A0A4C1UDG5_EUMVA|nr:Putative alpha-L-fucosidase [Eumeta japonica]
MPKRYLPDWSDLDKRPLPEWYDRAKVGIFLHWGVFSVPSFGSEWFWNNLESMNIKYIEFMKKNYPPGYTYQDFAHMFTAEFFDPDEWADLFNKSGAKYVVLTSKHHEGYTLFPSKRSFSWNAVDIGPHRDLVKDLADAVREKAMKFGVYHSLFEWYNPIYKEDKFKLFETQNFPKTKLWPDLQQLVNDYNPSVIWADGDWEALDTYWNSTAILAWLYNDSPVKDEIVVNDRWGIGINCHHGDFFNCVDRYNPGKLQPHKWENAFTLDKVSWGYRRNMILNEVMTIKEVLRELVSTVSCGGNVLINVGPTKEGTISPIFQERLLSLGDWLNINGEAIYNTSPWIYQNDTLENENVWYTCTKLQYNAQSPTAVPGPNETVNAVYAIFLKWPENNILWKIVNGSTELSLPDYASVTSQHAWSLKLTHK